MYGGAPKILVAAPPVEVKPQMVLIVFLAQAFSAPQRTVPCLTVRQMDVLRLIAKAESAAFSAIPLDATRKQAIMHRICNAPPEIG